MEDDFLDLAEDMNDVTAFFKNQRVIFDKASVMLNSMDTEKDYLQAEQDAIRALSQIRSILAMPKPYKSVAQLPTLMQTVQNVYDGLLALKKQEVTSEVEAAMGEIHQTAQPDQMDIVRRADDALMAKKTTAANAETLTQLDAMRIQIANHDVISNFLIERQFLSGKHTEPTKDTVDELKKYKELLDTGIITQQEFETKKKELLGESESS